VECDDIHAGKRGRCPSCNQKLIVPVLREKTQHEDMLPGAEDLHLLEAGPPLEVFEDEDEEEDEPFWSALKINNPQVVTGMLVAVTALVLLAVVMFSGNDSSPTVPDNGQESIAALDDENREEIDEGDDTDRHGTLIAERPHSQRSQTRPRNQVNPPRKAEVEDEDDGGLPMMTVDVPLPTGVPPSPRFTAEEVQALSISIDDVVRLPGISHLREVSPNGRRVLYLERHNVSSGKQRYTEIGIRGDAPQKGVQVDDQVWTVNAQFSADGRRWAVGVKPLGQEGAAVLIDGRIGPVFEEVKDFAFSADGLTTFYIGRRDKQWFVVVTGLPAHRESRGPSLSSW